jgi:hypothetical protein
LRETVKFSLEPESGEIRPLKVKLLTLESIVSLTLLDVIVVILPSDVTSPENRYLEYNSILLYIVHQIKNVNDGLFIWFIVTVAFPSIVYEPPDIVIGFVSASPFYLLHKKSLGFGVWFKLTLVAELIVLFIDNVLTRLKLVKL